MTPTQKSGRTAIQHIQVKKEVKAEDLPDTARLNRSFPNVSLRSFGVSDMKVMVAALPNPANNPSAHIKIESMSSRASFIVQNEQDCSS